MKISIPVKLEGVLVHRLDPDVLPVQVSEEFDARTNRGPLLTLTPASEIESTLGSTDPESILTKRFALPLPPVAGGGFGQSGTRIDFGGFNNGNLFVLDAYFVNGWLWPSGAQTRTMYVGSSTNPFLWDVAGDSIDLEAPLYSWDFLEDGIAGNGNNRACSPASGRGPEGKFLVLVERGDCLFAPKVRNAALAGAAGVILYDSTASQVLPGSIMTPDTSIPAVFIRRSDGLALLNEIREKGEGNRSVTWRAVNLFGSLNGSVSGSELKLNVVLTQAWDYMFSGTVTGRLPQTPSGDLQPSWTAPAGKRFRQIQADR
ncbi:MAG: hypothetical protein HY235_29835 [Acidobacteria bacterium]|nr:hypothetical protein [Acidobacteriota bacterium]